MGANNPNFGQSRIKEVRDKISKALMGRQLTAETKAKIREANLGDKNPNFGKLAENHHNFGKALSEERKLNLSYKLGTAIEVYDTESEDKSIYPSQNRAAIALACGTTTVGRYIESQKLFRNKYRITKTSNKDVKEGGEELPLKPTLSGGSDLGLGGVVGVLRGPQPRVGFNLLGRRKYHSSSISPPLVRG